MTASLPPEGQPHDHTAVTMLVLKQRDGIPYEFERVVCDSCKKLLAERKVRRAAA
jgi:hypothetical protein